MPEQPGRPSTARPGAGEDRLMVVGTALVGIGFLATIVTLVPLFTGGDPLPLPFYLLSLLAPAGLGLILVALWRRARQRRRRLGAASPQVSRRHHRQ